MKAEVIQIQRRADGTTYALTNFYHDEPGVTGKKVIAGHVLFDMGYFTERSRIPKVGQVWDVELMRPEPA